MKTLKPKTVILGIKMFIIILNFVAFFYLFSFYKKYVYDSIVVDEQYITEQSLQKSTDIDLEQFNKTLEKLGNQKKEVKQSEIRNFFE